MGRERNHAKKRDREETTGGGGGGGGSGNTGGPEEKPKDSTTKPTPEELVEQLATAVTEANKVDALKLVANGISQGIGAPEMMGLIAGAGLRDGFFELIRNGRPHSAIDRARMNRIYQGGIGYEDKVALFEARYNITISGDTTWEAVGEDVGFVDEGSAGLEEGPGFTDEGPAYIQDEEITAEDAGIELPMTEEGGGTGPTDEGGDVAMDSEFVEEFVEEGGDNQQWVARYYTFTEDELDTMYEEANRLPAGHVEDSPTFRQLHRLADTAAAEGTHGGSVISMRDQGFQARYATVFRHEVGHAMDAALGTKSADLRLNQAGWNVVGAGATFAAIAGYGKIPVEQQASVLAAVENYMSGGGPWDSPGLFDDFLAAEITDETALDKVRAEYGKNLLLDTMRGSEGRFYDIPAVANWAEKGSKAYFVNFYYRNVYSINKVTRDDLVKRGNSAAAFSDKEWFAEMYQEWYGSTTPGSGSFPSFVKSFFKKEVEPYVAGSPPAGGGGGNPKVPR